MAGNFWRDALFVRHTFLHHALISQGQHDRKTSLGKYKKNTFFALTWRMCVAHNFWRDALFVCHTFRQDSMISQGQHNRKTREKGTVLQSRKIQEKYIFLL